ncbi:MAG: hypothetical protein IM581_02390 [Chitinophagaceae bacterium]|nr:hypothetical protein [Chitinophagaceae bacterium]
MKTQIFAIAVLAISGVTANAQAGLNVNSTINATTKVTANTAKVTEAVGKATDAASKATRATIQASKAATKAAANAAANTSSKTSVNNSSAVSAESGSLKVDGGASVNASQNMDTKPVVDEAKMEAKSEVKDAKTAAGDLRKDNQVNVRTQSANDLNTDSKSASVKSANESEVGVRSATPGKAASKAKKTEHEMKNMATPPKASGSVSGSGSATIKKN